MSKLIDLTGKQFTRLTVLERAGTYVSPTDLKKTPTWRCRCECGTECVVLGPNLTRGLTRSCGCLRKKNGRRPKDD